MKTWIEQELERLTKEWEKIAKELNETIDEMPEPVRHGRNAEIRVCEHHAEQIKESLRRRNEHMNYTNDQLKQALARLLPDKICFDNHNTWTTIRWANGLLISDTELLHLCWMVEQTFNTVEQDDYINGIYCQEPYAWESHPDCHATWQQRVIALAKVKGIEI